MQNALSQASSPYLLQHKDNPVHWQQWSDETLALAKELDKPILLSIGYSSCHWCHVMAHESFEDEGVARVMNEHFINIKLDREERPDLDKTYQLAHQLLNRQAGGWPLTAVLDPQNLVPFFSGTYFPKDAKYGLPAFTELLAKISEIFKDKRDEIGEQNQRLTQALQTISRGSEESDQNGDVESLSKAFLGSVEECCDKRFGGMEGAPKFPQSAIWHSALHLLKSKDLSEEDTEKLSKVLSLSTQAFCRFGLFDHLAGGFFRYCVDERWEIPHFEKMLYDNGQLLSLVAETGHYFADGQLMQSVDLTIQWLKEQMLAPEGGFYSALDADSQDEDGHSREGAYYCWQPQQLDFLTEEEQRFTKHYFGLNQEPNFEGQWHLVTRQDWRDAARELEIYEKQAPILLESARQQLKMVRDKRPLPFRVDKLLTSWNALTLQGLLQAKRAGSREATDGLISGCKNFIQQQVQGKQLFACYKSGESYQEGFLDDYGYLAKALLVSLSDNFTQSDWSWLKQLCEALWDNFADQELGGFFFTSNQQQEVITRHKSWSDDAMPSSSAQALEAIWVVAELTNNLEWLDFVEKSLRQVRHEAKDAPLQYASAIRLIETWQQGLELWVVRGAGHELPGWREYLTTGLNPGRWVFAIENGVNDLDIEEKFPAQVANDNSLQAYCCRQRQCFPAITDFESLKSFASEA